MDNPNFNTILREALDAAEKDTVITNADRIRAMSDEELAIWLADREIKAYTKLGYWGTPEVVRAKYLDWLKSPAADDA